MAARVSLRPVESFDGNEPTSAQSDVWPLQNPARSAPSPAAFAIHDAKNMVGVLSANIEVLRIVLAEQLPASSATDALTDMHEAVRRLGALLREALTELQGNRVPRPAPRARRVAPIISAVVAQMRPAARARGVRIIESGAAEAHAIIEPDLLERVLTNLLENAARFSQPGDTIEVDYENRRGRMTLAVGDRGPGVPENAREQLFLSYRRADTSELDGSHFGLGLAFCREVARAHGGDAWVFNRSRGGACFVFEVE